MLRGFPVARRVRGLLGGYPMGRNPLGQLSGVPDISRRLDWSHPISRNIEVWNPLDDGRGAVARDLCAQNVCALTNISDPATSTSGWGVDTGNVPMLRFDGSNDHVNEPYRSALPLTGDLTLCCWVYMNSMASNNSFICKGNVGAGYPQPFVMMANPIGFGSWLYISVGNGASQTVCYSDGTGGYTSTPLTAGVWWHIAATSKAKILRVYANGNCVGTVDASAQTVSDGGYPLLLGSRGGGSPYYLNGRMRQSRVFSRALEAWEVKQIYNDSWIGSIGGIQ